MSIKSNTVKDIRFEASRNLTPATASAVSKSVGFLGLVLGSEEIAVHPITSNKASVIRHCWDQQEKFLLVSGDVEMLTAFLAKVVDACGSSSDESEEALNVLLDYPELNAVEYRFPVEAISEPSSVNFPSNISEEGKSIWKAVLESDRYRLNVRGRSMQVRWAIAMKMYMDKALRVGAKPFAASLDRYSKKDLTDSYNNTLSLANSFEAQLFYNVIDRGFVKEDKTPWRFKEVSYNDKRFVCVLEKSWFLNVDKKRFIRHLVVNEKFTKNDKGAGYVHSISPKARLRIRVRNNTVEVALFVLFGKDKLVHSLLIDKTLKVREMLNEFHTLAKRWFKLKRF